MRYLVRRRLKAPSTADLDYSAGSAQQVEGDSLAWLAWGEVDSENSSVAMLRMRFECDLKYDPADDTWQLVDLRTNE